VILAVLFPGLTALKFTLGIICFLALVNVLKANIRAGIRADALREHVDTRVRLRDWFDPEHRHLGNANDEEGPNE